MADKKTESTKKSSVHPLIFVGVGCLVLLILAGIGMTLAARFVAKKVGTSLVESVIENKTGIKANLDDVEKGKMTFTDTKTGESINVGTGKLPDAFPSDFPTYPGAKVEGSLTGSQTGSSNGIWVTFTSPDEMTKIAQFYKTELKNKGWTITGTMEVGTVTTYTVEKSQTEGSVAISTDDDKKTTGIMITLAKMDAQEE